jgi:molecular chaperone GrpE
MTLEGDLVRSEMYYAVSDYMDKHKKHDPTPDGPGVPPFDSEPVAERGDPSDPPPHASEAVEADDAIPSSTDVAATDGAALEQALNEEREKYLRLAAEFDNYRKRNARERQEAGWRAQSELVAGLVESLDDIMRFAHLDPATVDSATVVQGVALVEKKILKTLGGHGLDVLNPIDQLFDPAFHEAVGTEAALSREDDHLVSKVYQAGFVFRGQLLRPARVVVRQWFG